MLGFCSVGPDVFRKQLRNYLVEVKSPGLLVQNMLNLGV